MSEIAFDKVSVYYDDAGEVSQVLKDLSFSFHDGKINVLLGPSGSGKTTIMKCLLSQILYNGSISIDGKPLESKDVDKRRIAYLDQNVTLYPNYNIYENIIFGLKNERVPFEEADLMVKKIAHELGLTHLLTRKTKEISLGQASRVALAKELIRHNDILMLDEPFAHLDAKTRDVVLDRSCTYIKENHMTVIFVTHDIQEALRVADHIYVLNEGKLIGEYDKKSIFQSREEVVKGLLLGVR